jgi:lysophospholipase L1-like esterase
MMGYYNPFPYLPQEQQQSLLPLLTIVNDVIENNTVEVGYTFVPTDKIIAKKVEEYIPTNDIHLSEAGYQLVAKEIWKAIGEQKQLAIEKNDMERAIGRR